MSWGLYEDRATDALRDGDVERAQVWATLAVSAAQREANEIALIALHGKDSVVGDAIYWNGITEEYYLQDYEAEAERQRAASEEANK